MKTNKKIALWTSSLLCLALVGPVAAADGSMGGTKNDATPQTGMETTGNEGMPAKYNKASGLIGMEVRNQNNEKLGEIRDVVFDLKNERVAYAVLAAPPRNLLGRDEKYLAVPLNAFTISPDEKHLILNADKAKVEAAAGFDRNAWPNVGNPSWGAEPFWQKPDEHSNP